MPRGRSSRRPAVALGAAVALAAASAGALWYRVVNPKPTKPDHSRIVVAAVGDSNTFGAGALAAHATKSYPAQLQRLLGDEYQVLNFGFSGRTLLASGDLPYTAEDMFVQSRRARPDIVLIMLGTNDTKPVNWNAEAFEPELAAFVRGYQELPNAPRVYLLTPPGAFRNPYTIDPRLVAGEVVPTVVRVAEETGAGLIDIHVVTADRRDVTPDGVHPNGRGYGLIARAVYDAIVAD